LPPHTTAGQGNTDRPRPAGVLGQKGSVSMAKKARKAARSKREPPKPPLFRIPADATSGIWPEVERLTGVKCPPSTSSEFVYLMTLAGFSHELQRQTLNWLGYPGREDAGEVPAGFVSVPARADGLDGNRPDFSAKLMAGLRNQRKNEDGPFARAQSGEHVQSRDSKSSPVFPAGTRGLSRDVIDLAVELNSRDAGETKAAIARRFYAKIVDAGQQKIKVRSMLATIRRHQRDGKIADF
jgi:hypothetical protein